MDLIPAENFLLERGLHYDCVMKHLFWIKLRQSLGVWYKICFPLIRSARWNNSLERSPSWDLLVIQKGSKYFWNWYRCHILNRQSESSIMTKCIQFTFHLVVFCLGSVLTLFFFKCLDISESLLRLRSSD